MRLVEGHDELGLGHGDWEGLVRYSLLCLVYRRNWAGEEHTQAIEMGGCLSLHIWQN